MAKKKSKELIVDEQLGSTIKRKLPTKELSIMDSSTEQHSGASSADEDFQDQPDNNRKKNKENEKKKPGRPRKNPIRQPQKRKGIVKEPEDERNHVEFLYDNPEIFKKLLSYVKSHAAKNIFITFQSDCIYFWCENNLKNNNIRIKVNCAMVNHYYCFEPLSVGISCDHLEKITSTIDKTYNSILILSQKNNIQNYIQIILKDDIDSDQSYNVELIGEYNTFHSIDHQFNENHLYTVNFKLPSKKFKAIVNNMLSFTKQVSIELHSSTDPLIFQYRSEDNKIKHTTIFNNKNIFTLRNNIEDGDTFHTSFKLEYVKAISSSLISEYIEICADENKPLLFINEVDGGCIEVRTLTQIIDKRKEIDLGEI